jgi:hypothetical protein
VADLAAGPNHPPYRAIERGELIRGARDEMWRNAWDMARADSFAPA